MGTDGRFTEKSKFLEREKMSEKIEDLNLPNAVVTRIIKEAVPKGTIISKDAKLGISRATSLFVLYIAQAAMENANDNKRKTVKESDVTKALEEADFDDLIPLIEKDLEDAKLKKSKKAKKQETEQPAEQETEQME